MRGGSAVSIASELNNFAEGLMAPDLHQDQKEFLSNRFEVSKALSFYLFFSLRHYLINRRTVFIELGL
jgi:hypothetical protein